MGSGSVVVSRLFSPVLAYTLIVSLGGFIFGFDASVISGAIGLISTEFSLSHFEQGFVVAAPTLGAIISTLCAGYIADRVGRRSTLMIIAVLYLISAVLSAIAPSYVILVAARFLGGLAFCSLMIAPMYIAEIAPADARGKMVSINQLNIVVGFSAAYFANYYLLQISQSAFDWVSVMRIDESTWRWMLGLEIAPAILYLVLLFVVPKSPRWLIINHKLQEAAAVLKLLYPQKSEETVKHDMKTIAASADKKAENVIESIKLVFSAKLRLALTVGVVVGVAQQATGVNAIYFYAPTIFEQTGVGTNAAFAQAIWIGIINVLFTLVAIVFIDKLGRRPLLIGGLSGVVISMAMCAYGYSQAEYTLTAEALRSLGNTVDSRLLQPIVNQTFYNDVEFKNSVKLLLGDVEFQANEGRILELAADLNNTLVLIGILGFVACFAFSLGPVMWVLFSEIFPTHVRGLAISVVGVINSIVSFTVQLVFPWELANIGATTTFLIYAGFAAMSLVFVIKLLPETSGKSLEELERALSR